MALSGDDQLVEEYRKAARRLRRLAGRGGNFLDQIDFPAASQDLFPSQGTEAGGALEALVLARKLVVVEAGDARSCARLLRRNEALRRGRRGGYVGPRRSCGLLRLVVIADFLPLFPAVSLAVDVDR